MFKRTRILLILTVFMLAACTPDAEVTENNGLASSDQPTAAIQPMPATTAPQTNSSDPGPVASLGELGSPMDGCTLSTLIRPADPEETSLFKPVSESDWIYGPEDASVTIIEYADFQCPFCGQLAPILSQLKADYPDDLRIVFRQYPLITIHDKAALAAVAAEAAGQQGMFWEMHDLLFQTQAEWNTVTLEAFGEWLVEKSGTLGMDAEQFRTDIGSTELIEKVQADYDEAAAIPIPGTPFLVINDRIYDGPTDYNNLNLLIRLFALEKMQYPTCPPVVIEADQEYIATILTEKGEIVIELLPQYAPLTVNNFVFLASEGWYNGVSFHRVLQGFMAQTGDPSGTGFGGPGYAFVSEISPALQFDDAGVVAMANSGADTNGSQFFITLGDASHLNGGYSIFGRVISGMDVVSAITLRDPSQGLNLPPGDKIISITIEEK